MKKIVLVISLLLMSASTKAYAEVTVKVNDNRDGTLTSVFYSNGKEVAQQLQKRDGSVVKTTGKIPDGIVKEHSGSEKVKGEYHYKKGALNGVSKWYYEDGTLRVERQYRESVLDGVTKFYYPSGAISGEYNYKNGKVMGKSTLYWGNGKVKSDDYYRDGKLEGQSKRFYETGELRFIDTYKNGERIARKAYTRAGSPLDEQRATSREEK